MRFRPRSPGARRAVRRAEPETPRREPERPVKTSDRGCVWCNALLPLGAASDTCAYCAAHKPIRSREPRIAPPAPRSATPRSDTPQSDTPPTPNKSEPAPKSSGPTPRLSWATLALGAAALTAVAGAVAFTTSAVSDSKERIEPAKTPEVARNRRPAAPPPAELGSVAEMPEAPAADSGLPETPDPERVLGRLRRLDASSCRADLAITVTVVVLPDGSVTAPTRPPPGAADSDLDCVRGLLKPLRFAASRRGLTVDYRFRGGN